MTYFSICAILRNEAPYLREWIEFHKLVGAERFFLYDNESTDGSQAILAPYVERGEVVLRNWPVFPGQVPAYDDCIARHGAEARWIAYIDLDEYLFSPTGRSVGEVLGDFEDFPGVGVNWANFGTSGHVEAPPGLVIENYVLRSSNPRAARSIKSIVDPTRVDRCINPHCFRYRGVVERIHPHYFRHRQGLAVDEQRRPIEGPDFAFTESSSYSLLRINHYWSKSEEEFREKSSHPRADTGLLRGLPGKLPTPEPGSIRDTEILEYVPALRKALEQGS